LDHAKKAGPIQNPVNRRAQTPEKYSFRESALVVSINQLNHPVVADPKTIVIMRPAIQIDELPLEEPDDQGHQLECYQGKYLPESGLTYPGGVAVRDSREAISLPTSRTM